MGLSIKSRCAVVSYRARLFQKGNAVQKTLPVQRLSFAVCADVAIFHIFGNDVKVSLGNLEGGGFRFQKLGKPGAHLLQALRHIGVMLSRRSCIMSAMRWERKLESRLSMRKTPRFKKLWLIEAYP